MQMRLDRPLNNRIAIVVAACGLMFLCSCVVVAARNWVLTDKPIMLCKQPFFDFGIVKEGGTATHSFEIWNVGRKPALIGNVSSGCHCTTIEPLAQSIIQPGQKCIITVHFMPYTKPGLQNQS